MIAYCPRIIIIIADFIAPWNMCPIRFPLLARRMLWVFGEYKIGSFRTQPLEVKSYFVFKLCHFLAAMMAQKCGGLIDEVMRGQLIFLLKYKSYFKETKYPKEKMQAKKRQIANRQPMTNLFNRKSIGRI